MNPPPPRRRRARGLARVFAAAAFVASGPARAAPLPPESRPDVLLLLVDTLSPGHLGCYGYARTTSPRIDSLAGESKLFSNAFATASWTKPSIPSLFTGRYPSEHGVFEGSTADRAGAITSDVLGPEWTTLAEAFAAAGYRTAAFVENAQIRGFLGFAQGFEVYDDRGGEADSLFARLREWLARADGRPYFAYVHLLDVHWPYRPPEPFLHRFSEPAATLLDRDDVDWKAMRRRINRGETTLTEADRRRMIDLYDSEIAWADDAIGKGLDALRADRALDRAFVVLTADHGEEFGEHGRIGHGQALRDALIRVPLLVRGPGVRPGRTDAPVSLVDVFPTLADLAGIEGPRGLTGRALAPILRGEGAGLADAAATGDTERTLFAERRDADARTHAVAARRGRWKLERTWKVSEDGIAEAVGLSTSEAAAGAGVRSATPRALDRIRVKIGDGGDGSEGSPFVVEELEPLSAEDDEDAVKGPIGALDAAARTLSIEGVPIVLAVDAGIGSDVGAPVTLSELRPGDKVKAEGEYRDGRLACDRLKVYRGETGRSRLEGSVERVEPGGASPRFVLLGRTVVLGAGAIAAKAPLDARAIAPLFAPDRLAAPGATLEVRDVLYDLESESGETRDVRGAHPDVAKSLAADIEGFLRALERRAAPPTTETLDPESLRALEELGYLR